MANKKYTEFPAGTYDTSKIFLQADAATGALEKINLPVLPSAINEMTEAWNLLGASIIAQITGFHLYNCSGANPLVNGQIKVVPILLLHNATITGFAHYQSQTGDFTGNNFNGGALYTYSAGVLTRVAITNNDPNIWKGTVNTIVKTPFTSTYNAVAGLYFLMIIYCNSTQVTAPSLPNTPTVFVFNMMQAPFTNSAKFNSIRNSQTTLPTTENMTNLNAQSQIPWLAVY